MHSVWITFASSHVCGMLLGYKIGHERHCVHVADDSFYLSMRYVRVFGSACAPQEAVAMRSWIARPLPPPDVLGPACAPPSLAQSMDISGSTSLPSGSQQQVLTTQDTSTCVIELPSWAQRDIVRALCQISENDGRSGGGKWKSEDGPLPAPCCDEGAYARAQPTWLGVGLNEFVGAHGDPHSPGTTGTTAITSNSSHTSTGLFPHAWGVPAHSLYSRRRQRRSSTAGLLEHMLVRGMSRQCRPTCCPGNNSGATEESEVRTNACEGLGCSAEYVCRNMMVMSHELNQLLPIVHNMGGNFMTILCMLSEFSVFAAVQPSSHRTTSHHN